VFDKYKGPSAIMKEQGRVYRNMQTTVSSSIPNYQREMIY
jgi:hypothetical protein